MDREHLLRLYDREYAESYNAKFLSSEISQSDTNYEIELLARYLEPGMTWLDVACGTGFFLSRFPQIERAGLDLSPAMLALAKRENPGVPFHTGSYLDDVADWHDAWDLVSCMWYAYGLVSSMADLLRLVANLAAWTSPRGRCFVPLADPRLISGVNLPYVLQGPWPGQASVTGILWSYAEDGGTKVHEHQIAPQVELMEEMFGRYFEQIDLETYPPAMPGWEGRRRALVASRKKRRAPADR